MKPCRHLLPLFALDPIPLKTLQCCSSHNGQHPSVNLLRGSPSGCLIFFALLPSRRPVRHEGTLRLGHQPFCLEWTRAVTERRGGHSWRWSRQQGKREREKKRKMAKKSQKNQAKRKERRFERFLKKFSRLTPNPPRTRQTRSKRAPRATILLLFV